MDHRSKATDFWVSPDDGDYVPIPAHFPAPAEQILLTLLQGMPIENLHSFDVANRLVSACDDANTENNTFISHLCCYYIEIDEIQGM